MGSSGASAGPVLQRDGEGGFDRRGSGSPPTSTQRSRAALPSRRRPTRLAWLLALVPIAGACDTGDPPAGDDDDLQPDAGPPDAGPELIFPLDFKASYRQVRACRSSPDHASFAVVWADPIAADGYQADASPLPASSVLLKEEFADPACTELIAWSAMRKEPGFDAATSDWHWQRVCNGENNGCFTSGIVDDGRVRRCSSCHESCLNDPDGSAHLDRDYMCAPAP